MWITAVMPTCANSRLAGDAVNPDPRIRSYKVRNASETIAGQRIAGEPYMRTDHVTDGVDETGPTV